MTDVAHSPSIQGGSRARRNASRFPPDNPRDRTHNGFAILVSILIFFFTIVNESV